MLEQALDKLFWTSWTEMAVNLSAFRDPLITEVLSTACHVFGQFSIDFPHV